MKLVEWVRAVPEIGDWVVFELGDQFAIGHVCAEQDVSGDRFYRIQYSDQLTTNVSPARVHAVLPAHPTR